MIFFIMFVSSCYQAVPIIEPVLSHHKMKVILKDIHLAEALLAEITDRRSKDSTARVYYGQIFRLHQVKEADFDQSMNAYFSSPIGLDSLYNDVIIEIAAEKEERSRKEKK